ncbi:MAG: UDP-N-acetylmuramate--L-alanine ligase, partial [Actinobacteria bacterium]|nr:UDP-N-acetylmuramate--L-alanine ligase [Actinomycetota bacterium]
GLDLDVNKAASMLQFFTGVKRRFEKRGEKKGAFIFDDYAHHPTEVKATLEAAAIDRKKGRIITVFQPHRYTRLLNLHSRFAESFDRTDILIVSDVFGSDEPPIAGVSGKLLVDSLAESGFKKRLAYIPKLPDIRDYLYDNIRKDDIVLVMGAGDITRVTDDLLKFRES